MLLILVISNVYLQGMHYKQKFGYVVCTHHVLQVMRWKGCMQQQWDVVACNGCGVSNLPKIVPEASVEKTQGYDTLTYLTKGLVISSEMSLYPYVFNFYLIGKMCCCLSYLSDTCAAYIYCKPWDPVAACIPSQLHVPL